jgi:hypothetical protein
VSGIDLVISFDVRGPERLGRLRQLGELGSPKREAVVRERPVPEGVADTVAELVARLRDALAALQCGHA